jgi:hypothetical protein
MQDKPEQPPDTLTGLDYQETHRGKCITCGFAAKLARQSVFPQVNRQYSEIPFDERQEGSLPVLSSDLYPNNPLVDIVCFRGKCDLISLVNDLTGQHPAGFGAHQYKGLREVDSRQVLEETGCDSWYQYEPGRTPQEHLSDSMWEQLEKQRREYEQEREKDRRAFEERLESERREFDTRLTLQLENDRRRFESNLEARLEADRRDWIEKRDESRGIAEQRNRNSMKLLAAAGLVLALLQVMGMTKDSLLVKGLIRLWHFFFG